MSTFITAPTHCTGCGAAIASGHAFCPGCGRQVGAAPIHVQATSAKKHSILLRIFAAIGAFVVVCLGLALLFGGGSSTNNVAGSSPAEVHQIGDTVHVGYWSYRVNGFSWSPALFPGDGVEDAELADARFIMVDLTIRNDDRTPSTLPRIVLVDSQGREFQTSSKAYAMPGAFDILKDVNPGVESHGFLVFDVPPGQYSIRLSGGIQSSDSTLVDLKKNESSEDAPVKPSAAAVPEETQSPQANAVPLQPAANSDPSTEPGTPPETTDSPVSQDNQTPADSAPPVSQPN